MTDIEGKIKPGDTVKVRIQTETMKSRGVDPIEATTKAYQSPLGGVAVADYFIPSACVEIVKHVPARPDWADAQVVRLELIEHHRLAINRGPDMPLFVDDHGHDWTIEQMAALPAPVTVVLDADGNPPTTEHPDRERRAGWEIEVLHPDVPEEAREALENYQDEDGLTFREMDAYLDGWDAALTWITKAAGR